MPLLAGLFFFLGGGGSIFPFSFYEKGRVTCISGVMERGRQACIAGGIFLAKGFLVVEPPFAQEEFCEWQSHEENLSGLLTILLAA